MESEGRKKSQCLYLTNRLEAKVRQKRQTRSLYVHQEKHSKKISHMSPIHGNALHVGAPNTIMHY